MGLKIILKALHIHAGILADYASSPELSVSHCL